MATENKPVIHTAATAHLDTIWNWDFETTIRHHIRSTLDKNFRLFEKYPEYVFSFEGSRRYELMEEYYPLRFRRLKQYVADGRWHVTGSAYENGDVNVPSPEALFRNILYGQDYFMKTFGKKSVDIYLPDCFGFGMALPSVMKHAGLLGFTTQKLTWSSAYGIPFDLGIWRGIDGSDVFASLNALSYNAKLEKVRDYEPVAKKLKGNIERYGLPMTYVLHGTGDIGGSPTDGSVETTIRESRRNETEDTQVTIDPVDKIFREMDALPADIKARLPVWEGELISTDHGVGGYTSRAIGKRWNKRNEQLADAAERTCCAASWLGVGRYPAEVLDTAWKRVIAHQFHDDLPGTSVQRAYKRSWNEYGLSLNQFAGEYTNAVESIASLMRIPATRGVAVVVSNTTDLAVTDCAECTVALPEGTEFVKVRDANGKETPSQLCDGKVVFTASVPGNSIAAYTILPAVKPYAKKTGLSVSGRTLENRKYTVTLNDNGDIASVYDKILDRELLRMPVTMDVHSYDGSEPWPAWELDYKEVMALPEGKAGDPVFTIEENGCARVVLKTVRTYGESVFTQRILLGESSETLRIENEIEWRGLKKLLKTPFVLTVSNRDASYDLGLGVIKRGLNTPALYEVPGQNWADISNGAYGVSVFSDSKYGWDHPYADTIRLTGIHTPKHDFRDDSMQSLMDLGRNRYAFGIYSHRGTDLTGTQQNGAYFSRPLAVFAAPAGNNGPLPPVFTFASVSDSGVLIKAIKKELNGNRVVVRVAEGAGRTHTDVHLKLGDGILAAREILATEEDVGEATVRDGELHFSITPYAPKSFALTLKPAPQKGSVRPVSPLKLPYNAAVTSSFFRKKSGLLNGHTIPTELFPAKVVCKDVTFMLSEKKMNALSCRGQILELPEGTESVSLLLTSAGGDKTCVLESGDQKTEVFVPDCFEALAAWDLYGLKEKGYIKPCTLAYEITHMHRDNEVAIAKQCWLFRVDVPASGTLKLPCAPDVFLFAADASNAPQRAPALSPLYDTLDKEPFDWQLPKRAEKKSK